RRPGRHRRSGPPARGNGPASGAGRWPGHRLRGGSAWQRRSPARSGPSGRRRAAVGQQRSPGPGAPCRALPDARRRIDPHPHLSPRRPDPQRDPAGTHTVKQRLHAAALVFALVAQPLPSAFAQPGGVTAQDADIRAFIQDVARATDTTFIIDPAVEGSVSITRDVAMDEAELLGVLLAVLRANGLVAVSARPGAYRVVPDSAAAQLPGSGSAVGS